MHSIRGTFALAAAGAALLAAPGAQADPTVQLDTSSTQWAHTDARIDTGGGTRVVKSKIELLGVKRKAAATDAGDDTAGLLIQQTKCISGTRHWRRFLVNGARGVTFDIVEMTRATLTGTFTLAGTELTAASCDAKQPDASTAKPLGSFKVGVDATWGLNEPGGDGTDLAEDGDQGGGGNNGGGGGNDPLAPPELPPPPTFDPTNFCYGAGQSVSGGGTGWRGALSGAESLPLYAKLNWASLTPDKGGASIGSGTDKPVLMVGTACPKPQRAVRSRARGRSV